MQTGRRRVSGRQPAAASEATCTHGKPLRQILHRKAGAEIRIQTVLCLLAPAVMMLMIQKGDTEVRLPGPRCVGITAPDTAIVRDDPLGIEKAA
jgi:hypothetical protein